jgi:hypothetical protein
MALVILDLVEYVMREVKMEFVLEVVDIYDYEFVFVEEMIN